MFVSRFRKYADSNYHPAAVGKNDFNTPMPWMVFGKMKPEDLSAIYAYLKTTKPLANKVVRFEPASAIAANTFLRSLAGAGYDPSCLPGRNFKS